MMERQLTFIDTDENRLEVVLGADRIQIAVVDSRPGLEADQLRAFASALFATYVGGPLVAQLDAARGRIGEVRDRLAATSGTGPLVAELDSSLAAIAGVEVVLVAPGAASEPAPEPEAPRLRAVTPVRARRAARPAGP